MDPQVGLHTSTHMDPHGPTSTRMDPQVHTSTHKYPHEHRDDTKNRLPPSELNIIIFYQELHIEPMLV